MVWCSKVMSILARCTLLTCSGPLPAPNSTGYLEKDAHQRCRADVCSLLWQLAVGLRVPIADCVRIVLKHQVTTETELVKTSFRCDVRRIKPGPSRLSLIKISTLCAAARLNDAVGEHYSALSWLQTYSICGTSTLRRSAGRHLH